MNLEACEVCGDLTGRAGADEETILSGVVEKTGELVVPETPITLRRLRDYVQAQRRRDALQLRLADLLDEITAEFPEVDNLRKEIAQAEALARVVEEEIAEAFDDKTRLGAMYGITIDTPVVRVTWPKPANLWKQRLKPEAIASRYPELAKELGIEQETGKPARPRITLRDEKVPS